MSELPSVLTALLAVMGDVQAVRKTGFNSQQSYNFRGIDAVVNAVGPALRKHQVVVVPLAEDVHNESYSTRSGAQMRNTTVRVRFRFYGPKGDHLDAVTFGEAADAGDKSVAKAHSVAFRVALLQALCIPTDEPDVDEASHERAQSVDLDPRKTLWQEIWRLREAEGLDTPAIYAQFAEWSGGVDIRESAADQLQRYIKHITPKEAANAEQLPATIDTAADAAAAADRLRTRSSGEVRGRPKTPGTAARPVPGVVAGADGPGERETT